jgi:hypothetical protein
MLSALSLVLALTAAPPAPAEFFPVAPGTTWTYEEVAGDARLTFTERALAVVRIGEREAHPIESTGAGGIRQVTYYAFEGDSVLMLGSDPKRPLAEPYAILRVGERTVRWTFTGSTPFFRDPSPLELRGEASLRGERTVLGRRVRTLQVILDATVGRGETSVHNRQVAVYGRGIGLIELRETARIGKNKYERVRRLVGFETPATEAR